MGQKSNNNALAREIINAAAKNNKNPRTVVVQTTAPNQSTAAKRNAKRERKRKAKAAIKASGGKGNAAHLRHAGPLQEQTVSYLKCLLDPEHFATSYPDKYCDKTAVSTFIVNHNLKFDSDGKFFVHVNPTMRDHVVDLTNLLPAGVYTFVAQNNYDPAVAINSSGTKIDYGAIATDILLAQVRTSNNTHYGLNRDTNYNYRLPLMTAIGSMDLTSTDLSIFPEYSWDLGTTWTAPPFLGGIATVPVPLATTTVAVRWKAAGVGATANMTNVGIRLTLTLASSNVGQFVYNASDIDYYNTLTGVLADGTPTQDGPIYNEYRCVGLSCLLTYEGDTLYNGGNIAGRVVPGGQTPFELGWTDYSSIAEFPDSYERPLTMGAYGFWLPTDDKDMFFRKPDQSNYRGDFAGDLPSLVFAGTVKNAANAIIRLRVAMVLEAKVSPSFIPTYYSVVDQHQIETVAIALRGMPRIMENPLHMQDIKDFLKRIVNKGKEIYRGGAQFYHNYQPIIDPLITAGMAALFA